VSAAEELEDRTKRNGISKATTHRTLLRSRECQLITEAALVESRRMSGHVYGRSRQAL